MRPIAERNMKNMKYLKILAHPGLFGGQYSLYLTGIFSVVMVFSLYYTFTFIISNRDKLEPGWAKIFRYFIFFIFLSAVGLISSVFIPGEFGVRWIIFAISMGFSTIYYFLIALRFFDPGTPDGIKRKMMETMKYLKILAHPGSSLSLFEMINVSV